MQDTTASQKSGSARTVVAFMMANTSALFFFAFILEDLPTLREWSWHDLPVGLILRYALAMGLGGAVAGFLLAGLFGRRGLPGWVLALLAGVLATLLAGVVGSAVGLAPDLLADGWQSTDMVAILAGLVLLPLALVDHPWLILIWLALIVVTHLWARSRRSQPLSA
jgi:hypothetical protein